MEVSESCAVKGLPMAVRAAAKVRVPPRCAANAQSCCAEEGGWP